MHTSAPPFLKAKSKQFQIHSLVKKDKKNVLQLFEEKRPGQIVQVREKSLYMEASPWANYSKMNELCTYLRGK